MVSATCGSGCAQSSRSQDDGSPAVNIQLNGPGGQRMFDYSSENVGKGLAVVYIERIPEVKLVDVKEVRSTRVKEEVISVANIRDTLGKSFITSGLDSPQDAADLALLLRAGSLAAPMEFVDERTVGPSLGKENVERGLTAVLYSFGFALVFFLVYYRMFGVITCVALLLNLLMVIAVMSFLGATLTLPVVTSPPIPRSRGIPRPRRRVGPAPLFPRRGDALLVVPHPSHPEAGLEELVQE